MTDSPSGVVPSVATDATPTLNAERVAELRALAVGSPYYQTVALSKGGFIALCDSHEQLRVDLAAARSPINAPTVDADREREIQIRLRDWKALRASLTGDEAEETSLAELAMDAHAAQDIEYLTKQLAAARSLLREATVFQVGDRVLFEGDEADITDAYMIYDVDLGNGVTRSAFAEELTPAAAPAAPTPATPAEDR